MSQLVCLEHDGYRWQVRPEFCGLLFPDGPRIDDWTRAGQAQIIKHGPHRTVYRVSLPGLDCYLKHYRLPTARAWLRQLVRPSKARMEFDRANLVAERQVPTALPLALGEACGGYGPAESFLITRGLADTENLDRFTQTTLQRLPRPRQARVRQRLADELGTLLARIHDAGIRHNDLHAGNLLIRLGPDDGIELFLIDLHAVHLGQPLGWRQSRANLIMLNHWFVLHANRTDRLRFWHSYRQVRQCGVDLSWPAGIARGLEKGTWLSNLHFWRSRDRRCLRSNRHYQRLRSAGVCGYAVRELDAATLAPLLADPDAVFDGAGLVLLKNSRSSTVAELDLCIAGESRRVIYKRFRVTSWTDPWAALIRRSPALRSWVFGQGLRERGLPTARPLAVFHRRRRGLYHEAYLLTEKIPNAVDLHGYVASVNAAAADVRRRLLRAVVAHIARLVRELHRRNLSHRDLKAVNILMSPAACPWSVLRSSHADRPEAWLIDLVGIRLHHKLTRARRVQNLARLHASFRNHALVTRTDKLRFLRDYLQWGLRGRHGWKRWWREIERATQAKVARNLRSGRPLA